MTHDRAGAAPALPAASPASRLGPPARDPVALRRACDARTVEREGVPVVLALLDRRPGALAASAPGAGDGPEDGGELVALVDRYAAAVTPGAADDDAAALYSVVELVGFGHLLPGPAPAPLPGPAPA